MSVKLSICIILSVLVGTYYVLCRSSRMDERLALPGFRSKRHSKKMAMMMGLSSGAHYSRNQRIQYS
jgi:hypothetical protein